MIARPTDILPIWDPSHTERKVLMSGFFLDREGHIITNYHQILNAEQDDYQITLYDGRTYPANVVAFDPTSDLAILIPKGTPKVDIHSLKMENFSEIKIGEQIFTIGNLQFFENDNRMLGGIVSGKGETEYINSINSEVSEPIGNIFYTDIPTTIGFEGSPVLDSKD
jgi:S1-C subfamily serine protease